MSKENFQIAKDIFASYEARIQVVKDIVEDTHKMLEEFKEKREKMAGGLKETLATFQSLRKKDFNKMMEAILVAQKEREENVKAMLADFQNQETIVVKSLRDMLKKGESLRLNDFKKTLTKIKKDQDARQKESSNCIQDEITRMRTEVHEMLANFKRERETVSSEWEEMVALLAKKKQANK